MFSKKWCIFSFCLIVLFFGAETTVKGIQKFPGNIDFKKKDVIDNQPYVPNEIIVKFRKNKINLDSTFSPSSQIRKKIFEWTNGFQTQKTLKKANLLLLKIKEGEQIDEVIEKLKADPSVEYAEPNYYRKLYSLSIDDTYKNDLWGLNNFGQTTTTDTGGTWVGTSGADIDMERAWNLSTGTTEIIVAIIDSGVAYNHPDLIYSMWDGSNCKDEAGAFLGGCLHGYDYEDNDINPLPTDSSHGTHVAGTIAAERNNNLGIAGVGPKIKIMALKIGFGPNWDGFSEIKAIDFAIQNGAKVINASYGGAGYSTAQKEAIERFQAAGGIFVAAAGNDAENNDSTSSYPSNYLVDNIIAVAATDQNDALATFSNYGGTSVDLGAPGSDIFSTVADSALVDYDFDNIDNGSLPPTWTSDLGSSWGVYDTGITGVGGLLYGDLNYPYIEGVNSVVTSNTIDLSLAPSALFEFWVGCDTEYTDPSLGGDYLALEVSDNGTTFSELMRWNEYSLFTEYFDNYGKAELAINTQFLTSSFKYRFRWVTDTDGDTGAGDGCWIDDLKLTAFSDGSDEKYAIYDGTSMATPHVAGLAGYLWSTKPTATASEIKANILDNGDTLPSLQGKTVTGKRINAYKSLLALGAIELTGPSVIGLTDDAVPTKSKTFTWSSTNPATDQYRYLIDQEIDTVPTGVYGVGTSVSYWSGNGTFYIHVQARDESGAEGPVSTASFILDNTGPVPTLSSNSINSFVLSFGETLFNSVGQTIPNGFDLSNKLSDTSEIGISSATYNDGSIVVVFSGTPLAGSKISPIEGSENRYYDNLTNPSNNFLAIFDGKDWLLNPNSLNILPINIPELIVTGELTLLSGSSPESALSIITSNRDLFFSIGSSGAASSIGLTAGTIISESNDSIFDANLISGTEVEVNSVSNLEAGYLAQKVVQWGIPGTTLKFSQPVQVRIFVGSAFDGQVMNIYRSSLLSSGWTNTGLSSVNCTISGGYCAFAATEASYYVAAMSETPSPTLTPNPTSAPRVNNNSNQESTSKFSGPVCNDTVPFSAPDLFRISTTKGSAKIFFTPIKDKITGYAVMYGFKKGDERFAAMFSPINNNEGEQNFTINKLNPKATYYFKVTAYNGCVSGPWSDWIPAKADRKRQVHKYKIVIKDKIKTLVNQFK